MTAQFMRRILGRKPSTNSGRWNVSTRIDPGLRSLMNRERKRPCKRAEKATGSKPSRENNAQLRRQGSPEASAVGGIVIRGYLNRIRGFESTAAGIEPHSFQPLHLPIDHGMV